MSKKNILSDIRENLMADYDLTRNKATEQIATWLGVGLPTVYGWLSNRNIRDNDLELLIYRSGYVKMLKPFRKAKSRPE